MTPDEVLQALADVQKNDPVSCNGCTACCRGKQTVVLLAEHGDDPNRYPPSSLTIGTYGGVAVVQLKTQENGDCVFLRKGKCVVYDKRPAVCKNFDCRRIVYGSTPEQRAIAVQYKVFSQEIIDAGLRQQNTLKLADWEKEAYAPGNGYQEFCLGGPNKRLG